MKNFGSSWSSMLLLITLVVLPHGVSDVSRVDHLVIYIAFISFMLLGRSVFDHDLLTPYVLLLVAFCVPLIFNYNENTSMVLRELAPLLLGSYIISWNVKHNKYHTVGYRALFTVIGLGILLAIVQHLSWENYWLRDIYGGLSKNTHSEGGLYEKFLPPGSNVHIGFGFSLTPENLGWSSLVLGVGASAIVAKKRGLEWLTLFVILLANVGMFLSGWRVIWISYLTALIAIFFLNRRSYLPILYSALLFFGTFISVSFIVTQTNLLSPNSLVSRGAEERFVELSVTSSQTTSSQAEIVQELLNKVLESESVNNRRVHFDFFLSSFKSLPVFGKGAGSYPNAAYGFISDEYGNRFEPNRTNYKDPNNSVIKLGVEYGLWGLFFSFCAMLWLLNRLFLHWKSKCRFGVLEVSAIALFVAVAGVCLTRSYIFNSVLWFSFAFLVGSQSFFDKNYRKI